MRGWSTTPTPWVPLTGVTPAITPGDAHCIRTGATTDVPHHETASTRPDPTVEDTFDNSVLPLGCNSSGIFVCRPLDIVSDHPRRHLCMILVASAAEGCVPSLTSSYRAITSSITVVWKAYWGTQDTLRHLAVPRSTA